MTRPEAPGEVPVTLGHAVRHAGDPIEGIALVGGFLLAAPLAYGVIWFIGWIVAGFVGKRERDAAEAKPEAVEPEAASAQPQSSG